MAAEAVELQMVAKLPARRQLHVDLVAALHFQQDGLRAHMTSPMKNTTDLCLDFPA